MIDPPLAPRYARRPYAPGPRGFSFLRAVLALAALVGTFAFRAGAEPELHGLNVLARAGARGVFGPVATEGDRIALAEGRFLRILETGAADSATSGTLAPRGIVALPFAYPPTDLAMSGALALASGESGVVVVGLADPAAPTLATIPANSFIPGSHDAAVSVRGALGLVLDLDGSRLFDLTEPSSPVALGSWDSRPPDDPDAEPRDAFLDGGFAYEAVFSRFSTAEPGGTLAIHDVSNPAAPVERGRLFGVATDYGSDLGIAARDGIVLVGGAGGLAVVDARDPDAPREIASILATPFPLGFRSPVLEPGTTRAWGISRRWSEPCDFGFSTVDLADPASPTVLATSDLAPLCAASIAALEGRVALSRFGADFELREDPARGGAVLGTFRPPVSASEPVVLGDRVVFADHAGRPRVADPVDLAAFERDDPAMLDSSAGSVRRIAGEGGLAFVGGSGVSILEANPVGGGPPVEIGRAGSGCVTGIATRGTTLVVASNECSAPIGQAGPGRLDSFDIADPAAPASISSLADLAPVAAVGIGGDWIRLACAGYSLPISGAPELRVFRIDASGAFVARGGLPLPATPLDLVSDEDGLGYVVAFADRVARYEAPDADPLAAVERWSVPHTTANRARLRQEGIALLVSLARADGTGEFRAYDPSGATPALFASALGPACRGAATMADGRIVAAFEGSPGASLLLLEPVPAPLDVMLGDLDPTRSADVNEDGVVDAADVVPLVPAVGS